MSNYYQKNQCNCFGLAAFSSTGPSSKATNSTTASRSHSDQKAKDDLDSLLAGTMAKLSFRERQLGQEDLHGVSDTVIGSDDQIDAWLTQLEDHLVSVKRGSVYEMAETMNASYVTDRDFRLMFLRGNRYDAKAAAKQMIKFFNAKLQLFGKEKLTKDIGLSDLSEDDKDCLRTGSMWILPIRDRAGRQILFQYPGLRAFKVVENDLRARWYLSLCLLESQETQRKGFVLLNYAVGRYGEKLNGAGYVETTKLMMATPLYHADLHLCTDVVAQAVLIRASLLAMPDSVGARCKVHLGSDQECQYSLSTFGIPRQTFQPSPTTNEPIFGNFLHWYDERHRLEGEQGDQTFHDKSALPTSRPRADDVLFVSGQKMTNDGTALLRSIAKQRSIDYDLGSKRVKRDISDQMIDAIQSQGGRFLTPDKAYDGQWFEVTQDDTRPKISQMFRNYRRAQSILAKPAEPSCNPPFVIVDKVQPNDFLVGTTSRNNQGNLSVRQIVKELAVEYDSATKSRKRELTDSIVQGIKRSGGRFLRNNDHGDRWEEVGDDFARSKISKLFRNNRRSQKKDFSVIQIVPSDDVDSTVCDL